MQENELLLLAYGLIALSLILLIAELFLPSGIILTLALVAISAGLGLTFYFSPILGLATTFALFIVIPIFGRLLLQIWPKTAAGKKFFLSGPEEDATLATMPVNVELDSLRGRFGRTLAPHRPAGITDFDGKRVDTLSEGIMIDAGAWVRCIEVKSGKVIVRRVDAPDLEKLEAAEL